VNDVPHIGHAYTSIACDVMARFKRLCGANVKFLTGTDEHGQKVEKSAEAKGMNPKGFVDMNAEHFKNLAQVLNLSNDHFIRTTDDVHKKSVSKFWQKLVENGEIYLGSYSGWYSVRDEAFYAESELIEGKAPTGAPVEWVEEPSYFFRLAKWQEKLLEFYQQNPDFILPESRRNEVISFVKSGLIDLSVSRTSFKWGIPVPGDEKHVMYVWLDALANYTTYLGFPDVDGADFQNFWPNAHHIVGKDILRFHAIYWPAFLMAAGITPPKRVIAHGWWTNEGQKISKSLGNVIDPLALINEFGLDQTRYFLMREVPFGNDGDFSRQAMINRINSELSNNLGNLAQRTLSLVAKNCDGKVPPESGLIAKDRELMADFSQKFSDISEAFEMQKFSDVLEIIMRLAGNANRYIDDEAPWALKKTDFSRMEAVLHTLLECIRHLALYVLPFIPDSAGKLLDQLAIPHDNRNYGFVGERGAIKSAITLPAPEGIFPRFT
jgi:methionyl-tRNA synthetase